MDVHEHTKVEGTILSDLVNDHADSFLHFVNERWNEAVDFVYTILYALHTDATDSWWWLVFVTLVTTLQWLSLAFNDSVYFEMNSSDSLAWLFAATKWTAGFTTTNLAGLYTAIVWQVVIVGTGVAAMMTSQRLNWVWPMTVFRWVIKLTSTILFFPIMSALLHLCLGCLSVGSSNPNVYYTAFTCNSVGFFITYLLTLISICFFLLVSLITVSCFYDINPYQRPERGDCLSVTSRAHGLDAILDIASRFLLLLFFTCFSQFNDAKWPLSIAFLIMTATNLVVGFVWLPIFDIRAQTLVLAGHTIAFWSAICVVIANSLGSDGHQTYLLFLTGVPMAVMLLILSIRSRIDLLLNWTPEHLTSSRHVELKARLMIRQKITQLGLDEPWSSPTVADAADPALTSLFTDVEKLYDVGLRRFPRDPYMHFHVSCYYYYNKLNRPMAYRQLKVVASLPRRLDLGFFVFLIRARSKNLVVTETVDDAPDAGQSAHQIAMARALSGAASVASVQLYIEFRSRRSAADAASRLAAQSYLDFWTELMRASPDVDRILRYSTVGRQAILLAHSNFEKLLRINAQSVPVLRAYGGFILDMHGDIKTSSALLHRADEVEDQRALITSDVTELRFNSNQKNSLDIYDERNALVSMSIDEDTFSLIMGCNSSARDMYGYNSASEMIGKNINVIIPEPLASIHNDLVRRFLHRNTSTLLNRTRLIMAVHRKGYLVPISLNARWADNEASKFVGVMSPVRADDETVIFDRDTDRVTYVTRHLYSVFGITQEMIKAKEATISKLFPHLSLDYAQTGKGRRRRDDLWARATDQTGLLIPCSTIQGDSLILVHSWMYYVPVEHKQMWFMRISLRVDEHLLETSANLLGLTGAEMRGSGLLEGTAAEMMEHMQDRKLRETMDGTDRQSLGTNGAGGGSPSAASPTSLGPNSSLDGNSTDTRSDASLSSVSLLPPAATSGAAKMHAISLMRRNSSLSTIHSTYAPVATQTEHNLPSKQKVQSAKDDTDPSTVVGGLYGRRGAVATLSDQVDVGRNHDTDRIIPWRPSTSDSGSDKGRLSSSSSQSRSINIMSAMYDYQAETEDTHDGASSDYLPFADRRHQPRTSKDSRPHSPPVTGPSIGSPTIVHPRPLPLVHPRPSPFIKEASCRSSLLGPTSLPDSRPHSRGSLDQPKHRHRASAIISPPTNPSTPSNVGGGHVSRQGSILNPYSDDEANLSGVKQSQARTRQSLSKAQQRLAASQQLLKPITRSKESKTPIPLSSISTDAPIRSKDKLRPHSVPRGDDMSQDNQTAETRSLSSAAASSEASINVSENISGRETIGNKNVLAYVAATTENQRAKLRRAARCSVFTALLLFLCWLILLLTSQAEFDSNIRIVDMTWLSCKRNNAVLGISTLALMMNVHGSGLLPESAYHEDMTRLAHYVETLTYIENNVYDFDHMSKESKEFTYKPSIRIRRPVHSTGEVTAFSTITVNLHELVQMIITNGMQLLSLPPSQFNSNSTLYNFFALNAEGPIVIALKQAIVNHIAGLEAVYLKMLTTQVACFLASFLVIVLFLVFEFLPAYRFYTSEMSDGVLVLLALPRAVVKVFIKRYTLALKNQGDEEEGDDLISPGHHVEAIGVVGIKDDESESDASSMTDTSYKEEAVYDAADPNNANRTLASRVSPTRQRHFFTYLTRTRTKVALIGALFFLICAAFAVAFSVTSVDAFRNSQQSAYGLDAACSRNYHFLRHAYEGFAVVTGSGPFSTITSTFVDLGYQLAHSLAYGNEELGLSVNIDSAQSTYLFEHSCSANVAGHHMELNPAQQFEIEPSIAENFRKTCPSYQKGMVSRGLQEVLIIAMTMGDLISQPVYAYGAVKGRNDSHLPRYQNATYEVNSVMYNASLTLAMDYRELAWKYLEPMFSLSTTIYHDTTVNLAKTHANFEVILFGVTCAVLFLVYIFLVHPIYSHLMMTVQQATSMILAVPPDVVMKIPQLSAHIFRRETALQ